ncbi:uncharacterized protein LOC127438905 [Myxocyprinus asiaticus]|uniref:uncharacterized protein LOC127438905 n=1 Tax=Myxocyprinus asiaticus TaxID=70543 RepID=UPI00222369F7|nr:uncharacterized protein LOC127438905 [Myxocyprinus asiaticus]
MVDKQQEMSRRSSRLRLSGYYVPEDNAVNTSFDGRVRRISYRESPVRVFKKRSWARRGRSATPTATSNSMIESLTSYIDDFSDTGLDMDVSSNFKVAAQRRDKMYKTTCCSILPFSFNNTNRFPSGNSAAEKDYYSSTLNDSVHTQENPTFALSDVFHSPGLAVVMLCWWLENVWHTLNENISRISHSDVFQLSRKICNLDARKVIMFLFALCLIFGIWYCLPFAFPSHWHQTEMQPPTEKYTTIPARPSSRLTLGSLAKIKNEIGDVRKREANVMREITWLKLQNEKQKLVLQKDVTVQEMK